MTRERLAYETEMIKQAWNTALLTAGGVVGLWLGDRTIERLALAILGLVMVLVLTAYIISKDLEIRGATKEIV
jgi:uncharacterized membrane protein YfcA